MSIYLQPPAASANAMAIRVKVVGVALAVVALAVLGGCGEPASAPTKATPQVGVYTVRTQAYTVTSVLPGRTTAFMSSPVRPQIDGIIRERRFTEGAEVETGQLLYRIDPARYQAAYDSAKADLAQARAAVQSAAPRAERFESLARIDAISKQNRDDAVATLAQAKADVATARANLESARINLDYTRVEAPIAGTIGASSFTPGALVVANQEAALATIQQLDPIYVDIRQTATQYLQLKRALASGQLERVGDNAARLEVSVVGDESTRLAGRLEFAGASVNPDTGAVLLRAVVPNPQHSLLPGMYVRATLDQGVADNAILLPQQGVARTGRGEAYCLVVNADNQVARRTLTLATAKNDRWRVLDGLDSGDRVIIQGTQKVKPGDQVAPVTVTIDDDGHVVAARTAPKRAAKQNTNLRRDGA